jgi:membrane protein YdbS with pleckstrin-like domain
VSGSGEVSSSSGTSSPSGRVDRAAAWIYTGVWAGVVRWFRVPPIAPTLPVRSEEAITSFHPAQGFLRYLKFWFWIALVGIDLAIAAAWIAIVMENKVVGFVLLPFALVIAIVPDIIAFVAIHLRYDTTWYVMTPRSLRIRCGIWEINEITITFENVQNVKVKQGPVQRAFGIADVVIETAGGGGGEGKSVSNQAVIAGIDNAHEIRDQIMARVRRSVTTGLGDEPHEAGKAAGWSVKHLVVLREIRDEIANVSGAGG